MALADTKLSVLIVDDSTVYRQILTRILRELPNVTILGTASNGRLALEAVGKHAPDVVLLDVEMPEMNGLEALEVLRRDYPDVAVLMVSGVADAGRTLKALSLGAIDFIPKPVDGKQEELSGYLVRGLRVVAAKRGARARRRALEETKPAAPGTDLLETVAAAPARGGLALIGVSTGGPKALEAMLPAIPAELGCPIVIAQHMPAGFTETLAQSLDRVSPLSISEAKDGDRLAPGRAFIAPGGMQTEVKRAAGGLVLRVRPAQEGQEYRPSVDALFESVARNFDGPVLAAVMTGMGADGSQGVRSLRQKNCICVAQDEASSVVFGMPRVIVEAGLADSVLSLPGIAARITAFGGSIQK